MARIETSDRMYRPQFDRTDGRYSPRSSRLSDPHHHGKSQSQTRGSQTLSAHTLPTWMAYSASVGDKKVEVIDKPVSTRFRCWDDSDRAV